MPGKLCAGKPLQHSTKRESKSYCEGREAAANGIADTANPFPSGTTGYEMWDQGHASWSADPAGVTRPDDCCARPYGGGFVP